MDEAKPPEQQKSPRPAQPRFFSIDQGERQRRGRPEHYGPNLDPRIEEAWRGAKQVMERKERLYTANGIMQCSAYVYIQLDRLGVLYVSLTDEIRVLCRTFPFHMWPNRQNKEGKCTSLCVWVVKADIRSLRRFETEDPVPESVEQRGPGHIGRYVEDFVRDNLDTKLKFRAYVEQLKGQGAVERAQLHGGLFEVCGSSPVVKQLENASDQLRGGDIALSGIEVKSAMAADHSPYLLYELAETNEHRYTARYESDKDRYVPKRLR